ncbi:MAG: type IV secretion system DNA-binding domain-containing protein [Cyanothece sp. SIO1E1]|nr:type IV secretion system DNA-binding domain-containing protein [Cyanothece sp. SIO1E1]
MRFLLAAGASLLIVPQAVSIIQSIVKTAVSESNLAWLNPGNATGMVLSYAAAGGLVSLIAKAAAAKQVTVRGVLWLGGAITICYGTFITVRAATTFFLRPELGLLWATTATAILIHQALRLKFPEYPFDSHVQGQKLRTSKEVWKERGGPKPDRLPWGADFIDLEDETQHFIVMGNIGGGKTLFMQMCMGAIARRYNELWIVFDPKPQFIPYLEALGREIIILNPLDYRRYTWDIAKDINDLPTAETLAAALIKGDGNNDFWTKSARNLLVAVLMFLIVSGDDWDLSAVLNIVSSPEDLKKVVGQDSKNAIIAEGLEGKSDKSGTNDHMLTLNTELKKYQPVAALMHSAKAERSISLKGLIRSERYGMKALVLGNDEDSREIIKTFNGLIFEMMVNFILSLPDNRNRRIWAWIDELASVAEYVGPNLSRFQEKARSKGGCSFAATQSYPGLVAKIGQNYADQIIELSKRITVTGGVEGRTAEVFSETYFGSVEVVRHPRQSRWLDE